MKTVFQSRKTIFSRILFAALALLCLAPLLAGCGDSTGKKDLCRTLFSPYAADIEFVFEKDGESVAGTAHVTRADTVRIDITAPDPFTGISAEMGADDRADIISLSYSGIKAELPKNALDKLDLMLSLFADSVAASAEKTPINAFVPCEEVYAVEGLAETKAYKAEFSHGNIRYLVVYDSLTGTPLDLCAEADGSAVEVKIKKFKGAEF